mmetsp:Transcript_33916/g.97624  ORF Transcript_33916/g.97624 Transcript_33916/m.97624 type:complete len:298 (-) Transcript_33916:866-1759(-)
MQPTLLRQQVRLDDTDLLLHSVARQVNHLHTVKEWPVDGGDIVGGADEQSTTQVEWRVQVVVLEVRVLLRVEHFEQGRHGVEHRVVGHLVHLIEQDDGVVGAHRLEGLDYRSAHAADVCPPVASDLGLVGNATEGQAVELAAQGAGDGPPQGRLADARRAVEAEDRPLHVASHLLHGQELEQPRLHLVQAFVVLIKHGLGRSKVDTILGACGPWQRGHQLQVRMCRCVLRMVRLQTLQPFQVALRHPGRILGQARPLEALSQPGDLVLFFLLFGCLFVAGGLRVAAVGGWAGGSRAA